MHVHAHQKTETEHHRHHRAAAIGNQRHGNADDGDEAHYHQTVDHDVEEEIDCDPHREQASKLAARLHRDLDTVIEHQGEHRQEHHRTEKAKLFADHREDEIGLFFGEEIEAALRA